MIEQLDFARVTLAPNNPFMLGSEVMGKKFGLSIENPKILDSSCPVPAQDLLRTVMLAHLIGVHLPRVIETNFDLDHTVFLDKLYRHYHLKPPIIKRSENQVQTRFSATSTTDKMPNISIASTQSGGLDSLYRIATLAQEKNPFVAIHIRNLNPKNAFREAMASQKQTAILNGTHEEVVLKNASDKRGYDSMRTRDLFLGLVSALVASRYGSKKVFVEGGMSKDPACHFSEFEDAWIFFNKLIKSTGLTSQIDGIDPGDIETIGKIIDIEKHLKLDLIHLVQNCFSAPYQIRNNRSKWERQTPYLAGASPEHWCGSCIKCRRMTIGRIYYNDKRFSMLPKQEVSFFAEDTYRWLKKYSHNKDLISQSFMKHLKALSK